MISKITNLALQQEMLLKLKWEEYGGYKDLLEKKYPENKEHSLVTISSKEYKNMGDVNLFELENRIKLQFEVQNQTKVKTCILLTPPFLGGKLVSSCVVYYGT